MALMVSLSSCSPVTAARPQLSPSLSHSQNKPFLTLHSSPSILQADLIDDYRRRRRLTTRFRGKLWPVSRPAVIAAIMKTEPLRIMISGAPASGKGTQCELITKKYGLVHIAAGDLLRAEVAAGSENGKRAKEYMEKGMLVPGEIVIMMVKERLLQPDSQENGWLLDGYPRSLSQAKALEDLGTRPDLFILLDVSEDILVERVVGRRLDPVTGKIYRKNIPSKVFST